MLREDAAFQGVMLLPRRNAASTAGKLSSSAAAARSRTLSRHLVEVDSPTVALVVQACHSDDKRPRPRCRASQ